MTTSKRIVSSVSAGLIVLVLFSSTASAADCNRECLRGFVTKYLNALIAHKPGDLPLASNVKFTEDTVRMKVGEGLWKTATRLRDYRLDIFDVRQGVTASQVVMEEGDTPVLLQLRLKVAGDKITEIETVVVRKQSEGGLFDVNGLQKPRPEMILVPERSRLMSREEAIRIAQFYPAGLKTGSFITVDAPFASNAYRIENGRITAGAGCSRAGCENVKTQKIIPHPDLTQRLVAVDEELGIVLLRLNFGDTNNYGPGNALIVWELFKVYGGQIHAVEAFMEIMPAKAGSGWE